MITIPDLINIEYFLIASLVLLVIPGPAVLFIIANSIKHGYKTGLISVLGIGIGGLVHVVGAAVGLSAILVTSAYAFMMVKYLGATYLIYLGIKSLISKRNNMNVNMNNEPRPNSVKILIDGIIVNIFNPKTAIFFLAFLPQFISIEKGQVASQLIFLGTTFILLAIISDSIYVLLSQRLSRMLKRSNSFLKMRDRIVGFIYIILGILTLAIDNPNDSAHN